MSCLMLPDLELLKPLQRLPSMVLLVPLLHLLESLPRPLRSKNLLLLVKIILSPHLMLEIPPKSMPFSPPRQIKLRKVRRREKVKIMLIHRSKILLSLLSMIVRNKNLSILVLSVTRTTTLKTFLDTLKLVVCLRGLQELLLYLKSLFPLRKLKWWSINLNPLPLLAPKFIWIPIHVNTQVKEYPLSASKEPEVPSNVPSSSSDPLHIERPSNESVIRPPTKGVLHKYSYNPIARAAQHYSIVEDLTQAPSAMSALEVLYRCPPNGSLCYQPLVALIRPI